MSEVEVYDSARLFGGMLHGTDASGIADITFPNIIESAAFVTLWRDRTTITLRDAVSSLDSPCVIQIQTAIRRPGCQPVK